MMTLTVNKEKTLIIDKINKYCLAKGISARCHVSRITGNVIFAFQDGEEPEGLEKEGVIYEKIN